MVTKGADSTFSPPLRLLRRSCATGAGSDETPEPVHVVAGVSVEDLLQNLLVGPIAP